MRALLGRVLDLDPDYAAGLADDTPLFGSGLSLDSLTGMELLAAIEQEVGVDIAYEDLNLDNLQTVCTLLDYFSRHSESSQTVR